MEFPLSGIPARAFRLYASLAKEGGVETRSDIRCSGQLLSGMTMMAMMALTTAPIEKNKDNAVRRYCFFLGTFSKNNVPSVGILP